MEKVDVEALRQELEQSRREREYLREEIRSDRDLRSLTGDSPGMKAVRQAVGQVARTDSTVLVLGETGTGKELVARAIHQLSPRRAHLMVAVNCAVLASGIVASELFGHEPGAFTGALRQRIGRLELAQHGTLFLDEIGELPAETQVMLLRVLQERVFERVGGNESLSCDIRVIAATHRDLEQEIRQGRFRADLYFRFNIFPIRVPPLRERPEDIPALLRHFLQSGARKLNQPIPAVTSETLQLLMTYAWPGNVRELENIVERALIVTSGEVLEVDPRWLPTMHPCANTCARQPTPTVCSTHPTHPAHPSASTRPLKLAEVERQAIVDALEHCDGRIYGSAGAAALLGLKPTTLYGKMRKHKIERTKASGD